MANPEPFKWFEQAKFGLFIHWGLYALLGRGEQALFRERLNQEEYAKLADRFQPRRFDPDAWLGMARSAGMKYAVLTAKHHDGFCLFHSALTDYTSTKHAARRDIVAEYIHACRKHGLRVGLYYSLADWRFSAYFRGPTIDPEGFSAFRRYIHGQIEELCTNYGCIDLLWFDGGWPHDASEWQSERIDRMIRRHQPHVMINDRLHGGGAGNVRTVGGFAKRRHGYYDTAEQRAAHAGARPIETVRTTQDTWWGYCRGDAAWKSPQDIIHFLSQASHAGANLLLNVGPKPSGEFPARFKQILKVTGQWLGRNGEAIYGSSAGVLDISTLGRTTIKHHTLYLHVAYWPGRTAIIFGLASKVQSVSLLADRSKITFDQQGLHLRLFGLPARSPDPVCAVIKVKVDGPPREAKSVVHLWEERDDIGSLGRWAPINNDVQ